MEQLITHRGRMPWYSIFLKITIL